MIGNPCDAHDRTFPTSFAPIEHSHLTLSSHFVGKFLVAAFWDASVTSAKFLSYPNDRAGFGREFLFGFKIRCFLMWRQAILFGIPCAQACHHGWNSTCFKQDCPRLSLWDMPEVHTIIVNSPILWHYPISKVRVPSKRGLWHQSD